MAPDLSVTSLTQDEFLGEVAATAVTYHPSHGILSIGEAFVYEDGGIGYSPEAPIPVAATDFLEGSVLLFVRGIPKKEIDPIFIACYRGDFPGALKRLATVYWCCPKAQRGIAAPTAKLAEQLHWALLLAKPGQRSNENGQGGKQ